MRLTALQSPFRLALLGVTTLFLATILNTGQTHAATTVVKVGRNASNQLSDRYNPASITVNAGDTVRWEWDGNRPHDVTSYTSGLFASPGGKGGMTSTASVYSFTFATPGTYTYYCDERANREDAAPTVIDANLTTRMVGKVVVLGADGTGPATSTVVAAPNPTAGASNVTLTATISDAASGNSNIAGAEYFIDTAGSAGSGTAMTAADGSFSSATEAVTANVSVSAISAGSHTLIVRGRDSGGNWGATASTTLSVTSAAASALRVTIAPVQFPVVSVTGVEQTVPSDPVTWEASDTTGSGAGWRVTVTSTDFGSGANAIPVANFGVRLLATKITTVSGTGSPPTSQATTFVPLSTSAPLTLLAAATGTGMGTYRFMPDFQLTVPGNAAQGSYAAIVTVTIVSGP